MQNRNLGVRVSTDTFTNSVFHAALALKKKTTKTKLYVGGLRFSSSDMYAKQDVLVEILMSQISYKQTGTFALDLPSQFHTIADSQ